VAGDERHDLGELVMEPRRTGGRGGPQEALGGRAQPEERELVRTPGPESPDGAPGRPPVVDVVEDQLAATVKAVPRTGRERVDLADRGRHRRGSKRWQRAQERPLDRQTLGRHSRDIGVAATVDLGTPGDRGRGR